MKTLNRIAFVLFATVAINTISLAQTSKITPEVIQKFDKNLDVDCLIYFGNSVDTKLPEYLDKTEKGRLVYDALVDQAKQSQDRAISILKERGIDYTSYVVANALHVSAHPEIIRLIATLDEVVTIAPNPNLQRQQQLPIDNSISYRDDEPEWGIKKILADSVWQLGYKGQGAVIAGQDTGYDWDNAYIIDKYRGYNDGDVNHSYNWHDAISEMSPLNLDDIFADTINPCGLELKIPCDDHGHGSHTMGTMVGSYESDMIGVAPEASWIGCRNMEQGAGSPATYLDCLEWFLAPTDIDGLNPRPDLAPHVINNSWTCTEEEGCNASNWNIIGDAIRNLTEAGIVFVASAGNDGPNCNTIAGPPAMFAPAFVVGASNNLDSIANFSSRGLVTIDSSFLPKPDVVAPGVAVRSIWADDDFETINGTSMAGPHVAGTVALMISANPSLAGNVTEIESILRETAEPLMAQQDCDGILGTTIPNPVYGYGRINALKAVERALTYVNTDDIIEQSITVYPNPVSEKLFIKSDQHEGTIRIYNHLGKVMSISNIEVGNNQINVSTFPQGVYHYQILTTAKQISHSFVVKH